MIGLGFESAAVEVRRLFMEAVQREDCGEIAVGAFRVVRMDELPINALGLLEIAVAQCQIAKLLPSQAVLRLLPEEDLDLPAGLFDPAMADLEIGESISVPPGRI